MTPIYDLLKMRYFTLVVLLFAINALYADGLTSYSVVYCEVHLKDGQKNFRYMPIYGGDDVKKTSPATKRKGTDILPLLDSTGIFELFPSYYPLPLHRVVASEEVEKIEANKIRKIVFQRKMCESSGSLIYLPLGSIKKFVDRKFVNSKQVEHSCFDIIYLNYNPTISDSLLNTIVNLDPRTERRISYYNDVKMYALLNYAVGPYSRANKPVLKQDTLPLSHDTLHTFINDAITEYNEKISYLKQQHEQVFDVLYSELKSNYLSKIQFLKGIDQYIMFQNDSGLLAFSRSSDDSDIVRLRSFLHDCDMKNINYNTIKSLDIVWIWVYKKYSDIYDKALLKKDILSYQYNWD